MKRFLSLIFLLAAIPCLAVTKNKSFPEYQFNKGVDTYHAPTALPDGYVQNSLNVLFDDVAPATKRSGYSFSWGISTSSTIIVIQGFNDQFQIRDHGVGQSVKVPPGSYSPSALAATMTSLVAAQTVYMDSFTYANPYFVYQSTVGFARSVGFLGTIPVNFGKTIGFTPLNNYFAAGSGPVFVATAPATPIFTSIGPPIKGLWSYTDSSNTTWQIAWSSSQLTANNLSGTTVVIATVSANNTVGETNAFGDAYFVDQTQGVYYWTGGTSTATFVSGSPKGSIITQFHNRLWVTGAAVPNGNQLYGSGYYAGNTWTTGLNPTDPVQYSIGLQDNFDNNTAEYVYLDTLYIFKHSSIFALYGFDQTSFQISQLTQECGCIDGNTIQTFNSAMEFVSLRGVESFNGYSCTRISDAIKNKIDPAISVRSFTAQSWLQSQQVDWQAGTLTNTSATSSPPNLVLATQAAFNAVDNSQANWQAGTLNSLDSTASPPNLQLAFSSAQVTSPSQTSGNADKNVFANIDVAQSFTSDNLSGAILQSVTIDCFKVGTPGATTLHIKVDSANTPGSDIATGSFTPSSCNGGDTVISVTPIVISASTKYWIYFTAGSGTSNYWQWIYSNLNPYSGGNLWDAVSGNNAANDAVFRVTYQSPLTYSTTGSITSRVFDIGTTTATWLWNWGTFNTVEADNGQTISYATQVSSSASGPWDASVAVIPGGTIGSASKEFIQYIATFTTTNVSVTPVLSSVTITTSIQEAPTGYFKSQVWNVGSPIAWGNFSVQDALNGGSLAFSICSSPNFSMTSSSCNVQGVNAQILVATSTYIQWTATFSVTNANQTPILQSGSVQWYLGSNPTPMASTVWDNRYWLSLTTSSVDTTNDAVMVLNKSGAWAPFDIHAGAFTQYKNMLYHGDSSGTGNIYLDNQGWGDNGFPINSFINTRNESLGDLTADDYMYVLYPSAMATGNCTMTVQYSVDNSSTSYSLGSPLLSEFNSITSVRLPFPIDSAHQDFGQSIDFTLGTDDSQCGWQFIGIQGLYKSRPLQ